ncbi:50S ribosome-binding GTPase [Candidatus Woesearchaeota archaeon]|nr:50S ribosome-binding GTPase [Candidatus Woesearchaeota archaeon]
MNFQCLKKVERYDFYLDIAFNRAKKKADEERGKKKGRFDRLKKSKQIELLKLETIKDTLVSRLDNILKAYPRVEELDIFYQELIKCTLDYNKLKKSLGAINWCIKKINDFYKIYNFKIKKTKDLNSINKYRKEYYGRISSLLKQIKKELAYLEESRKTMKNFPAIKTKMFTVCISGFPNVGKSTLLSKLTSSKPEIDSYAFTTKSLNLGYMQKDYKKIQLIDTPGTLNRFNKMNYIEKQAYLAIKHLADLVVYVFDLTEEYGLKEQVELLKRIKEEFKKPVITYLSKTDIIEKEKIDKFDKDSIKSLEELKKQLSCFFDNNPA